MIGTDYEKVLVAGIRMGRLGEPEDIAKVVRFFASDDSAWVTGERSQRLAHTAANTSSSSRLRLARKPK